MADLIDRTARQVRSTRTDGQRDSAIHKLVSFTTIPELGRRYYTRCGRYLYADEGAVLTTADPDCTKCRGTSLAAKKTASRRELEDAGVLVGASP